MPRVSQLDEKRKTLMPVVARAFAELGYRRTTTAELAERCGVRENILYRLWPDKKAMFIAAIGYVYDLSVGTWTKLLARANGSRTSAQRVLEYESTHHGEFGHYRIVFAGLSETDDADIHQALADMYRRFHAFIAGHIEGHRKGSKIKGMPKAEMAAWAFIGLGTVADISRELGLVGNRRRSTLMRAMGQFLLDERCVS